MEPCLSVMELLEMSLPPNTWSHLVSFWQQHYFLNRLFKITIHILTRFLTILLWINLSSTHTTIQNRI